VQSWWAYLDGVTDNLLKVQLGRGGNFSKDHNQSGLGGGFAGDLSVGVLAQHSVQDGIGHLIAKLVWVSLCRQTKHTLAQNVRHNLGSGGDLPPGWVAKSRHIFSSWTSFALNRIMPNFFLKRE